MVSLVWKPRAAACLQHDGEGDCPRTQKSPVHGSLHDFVDGACSQPGERDQSGVGGGSRTRLYSFADCYLTVWFHQHEGAIIHLYTCHASLVRSAGERTQMRTGEAPWHPGHLARRPSGRLPQQSTWGSNPHLRLEGPMCADQAHWWTIDEAPAREPAARLEQALRRQAARCRQATWSAKLDSSSWPGSLPRVSGGARDPTRSAAGIRRQPVLPDPFQAVHSQEQPFLHLEWRSFPPVDSNHDTQIQSLMSCLLDEEGIVGWTR